MPRLVQLLAVSRGPIEDRSGHPRSSCVSVGTLRSGLRVRRERKNSFFPFSTEKLRECGTLEALGLDLCAEPVTVVAFVVNIEHTCVEHSMAI
jgi:hypothetical protein